MEGNKNQSDVDNLSPGGEVESSKPLTLPFVKKSRKLHKARKNVKSKEDTVMTSKKWWFLDSLLDDREEGLVSILFAWGRERGFYLLGLFCLLMCALLFALQAYMAFRSYKMLHQITTKRHIPQTLYQIYFDGHDWALDLDKVTGKCIVRKEVGMHPFLLNPVGTWDHFLAGHFLCENAKVVTVKISVSVYISSWQSINSPQKPVIAILVKYRGKTPGAEPSGISIG